MTRNYGMDRARGDYILFVDSDDYIKKNSLYDLIDFMKKRKLDVAFFGRNIDKQGKIVLGHDFFRKYARIQRISWFKFGRTIKIR